jgi:tetratricopeptide (TPR) repeat protein
LKEFIYDYYAELPEITPPAGVDIKTHKAELIKQLIKMKQEYGSIIRKYVQRMESYKNFLDKQGFSQTLAELLTNTLSIFPPERPKAEEILTALFSYLMKQAKKHFSKGDWAAALREFKHLERHFDEIALESEDEDPLFRERMIRHLQTHLDLYLRVCLGSGASLFHSGSFTLARDKFLKAETILIQQSQVLSVKARETYILKIRNNLAACTFMSGQIKKAAEEFERLLKAVEGTSPIVRNNLAVCARYQ